MLPKPDTCQGCPLWGDGHGFVPDEYVGGGAQVVILAQNPGDHEERGMKVVGWEYAGRRRVPIEEPNSTGPAPLIGATGYDMEHTYFPLAGLERGRNVSLCNVLKCRQLVGGKRTNDLPTGKTLAVAVEHCISHHLRLPPDAGLLVAMGALAAKVTGCPGNVKDWRGFTYPMEMCV